MFLALTWITVRINIHQFIFNSIHFTICDTEGYTYNCKLCDIVSGYL